MRFALPFAAIILACCAAPSPYATEHHDSELAGRTAGAPQRCVLYEPNEGFRLADNDRHVLLYLRGRTIWANHVQGLCGFSFDDLLISEPLGAHHCRGDIVHSLDRIAHVPGPSCTLGDFVPYTR